MVSLVIPLLWGVRFFLILVTVSPTLTNIPIVKSLNSSMIIPPE